MSDTRLYLHALYCDDIRHEVGGKVTYVGTYGPDMFVPEFPFVVPKLCVALFMSMPWELEARKLVARVSLDGDLIADFDADIESVVTRQLSDPCIGPDDAARQIVTTYFSVTGLQIKAPGKIKTLVRVDDDEIRGPALKILERPDQPRPD
jgi:hypothetical protein